MCVERESEKPRELERKKGARIPRFRVSDFGFKNDVKSEMLSENPAVQQGRERMQNAVRALTDSNLLDCFHTGREHTCA